MENFVKVLTAFFTLIFTVLGLIPPVGETYSPVDAENIKLNFAVISDTHFEGNNFSHQSYLIDGLNDMAGSTVKNDALVIDGDLTMNGQKIEYFFLNSTLKLFGSTDYYIAVCGNHDIGNGDPAANDISESLNRFTTHVKRITGEKIDNFYYYKVINDYYFIVLGSEADIGTSEYLSDEQLAWLDGVMKEAEQSGKPIFVFNHQPLFMAGEQSDRLYSILKSYTNVFFFSGHRHNSVDKEGITNSDSLYFVDVPVFGGYPLYGSEVIEPGVGYQVEAYENKVVFRARSYITGEWLEEYGRTVELP